MTKPKKRTKPGPRTASSGRKTSKPRSKKRRAISARKKPAATKNQGRSWRSTGAKWLVAVLLGVLFFYVFPKLQPELVNPGRSRQPPTDVSDDQPGKAPDIPTSPRQRPRMALLIDDLGHQMEPFERIADWQIPLAVAVLPSLAWSSKIAESAHHLGMVVLLHMPMSSENGEGDSFVNEELYLLQSGMTEEDIKVRFRAALETVPYVVGVNNHMGSLATQDPLLMGFFFGQLQDHQLFFVDSKTTPKSIAFKMAGDYGIPAIERSVFLDHIGENSTDVSAQIARWLQLARAGGSALAIGHPRAETLSEFERSLPELLRIAEFVPLTDLLE